MAAAAQLQPGGAASAPAPASPRPRGWTWCPPAPAHSASSTGSSSESESSQLKAASAPPAVVEAEPRGPPGVGSARKQSPSPSSPWMSPTSSLTSSSTAWSRRSAAQWAAASASYQALRGSKRASLVMADLRRDGRSGGLTSEAIHLTVTSKFPKRLSASCEHLSAGAKEVRGG